MCSQPTKIRDANMTTGQVHEVNSHSLLLRVEGSEAGSRPYMLAAHLDVVPPGDTDRSHV